MNAKVSIIRCKDYDPDLVFQATKKAVDSIGGISSFIPPSSKVLVKPNLLMAKEPEYGIDTHPQVVRAVVRLLKEINCAIYLGDGPSAWGNQVENVDEVYRRSGMRELCLKEGINLVTFEKKRWRGKYPLTTWLDDCEYFVSIPKFKTHDLTILTGAIKNLFGLVWGLYKAELHKKHFAVEDFANILVDIYQDAKPQLTVIDGILAMEGDGPSTNGKLRNPGLILAGSDCVALDSILTVIMGLEPFDILSTKVAAQRGLGVADINSISVLGERLIDVIAEPFKLPSTSFKKKIPRPIIEIAKKLIRFYPKVDYNRCSRCGTCIKACPVKVISMRNNRIAIDYKKCIACFCCQEACPDAAMKIKRSIVAKMVGL